MAPEMASSQESPRVAVLCRSNRCSNVMKRRGEGIQRNRYCRILYCQCPPVSVSTAKKASLNPSEWRKGREAEFSAAVVSTCQEERGNPRDIRKGGKGTKPETLEREEKMKRERTKTECTGGQSRSFYLQHTTLHAHQVSPPPAEHESASPSTGPLSAHPVSDPPGS